MKRGLFAAVTVGCLMAAFAWMAYHFIFTNEELASKKEWSILQGVEWQQRDKQKDQSEIVVANGYSIIGVPAGDRRKVWIMLNPRNPPFYKQLPDGNYTLPEDSLKPLLQT
jgi:hypothetical protein